MWLKGNNYKEQFYKGYELFEKKQYQAAVNEFLKAVELNPIGVAARFEVCEAYLAMQNIDVALNALQSITRFVAEKGTAARYFRRLGYIYTEKEEYKLAYACYKYSLNFEDNITVPDEIKYIQAVSGIKDITDEKQILENNQVNVFENLLA